LGALPSSLGSASSKFEATKYSAPGPLMLLSDPLLANLRLTDSRETEVGALPSSLGSASSKFEATKYSALGPLMLLSDPLLANLRLTDSRETEVGGSSFFSWVS
jgi:hypothetical protein